MSGRKGKRKMRRKAQEEKQEEWLRETVAFTGYKCSKQTRNRWTYKLLNTFLESETQVLSAKCVLWPH